MHDMEKLAYRVVVVMEKVPTVNRWQTERWQIAAVLPDEGHYQSPTEVEERRKLRIPVLNWGFSAMRAKVIF
jgi:hypothetical protein